MNQVKILFHISGEEWETKSISKIKNAFQDVEVKFDEKAVIGGGAQGFLPEINLLIVVGASFVLGGISNGFLGAIGEDLWISLKKGLKNVRNIQPDHANKSAPKEFKIKESEIITWVQFYNKQIIIHLPKRTDKKIDQALDDLPMAIDLAQKKNPDFGRIFWTGENWESM